MVRQILLFCLICTVTSFAQSQTDGDDVQSWNDVNITVGITDKIDLLVPLTLRVRNDLSQADDFRAGIGLAFKPRKSLSFASFHTFIRSKNRQGIFRTENRSVVRAVYKFPKTFVDISHRSQIDFRFRPGRNSWRYRPSITVEKPLPERWAKGMKLFVTEEPFYDSASGRFSRNRISGGVSKALNKKLTLELFYLRQGDNFSQPGTVRVIGTNWKIKL